MSDHFPTIPVNRGVAIKRISLLVLLSMAIASVAAVLSLPVSAIAAPPEGDTNLHVLQAAAIADAHKNLESEIRATNINRDLTVNDFLARTDGQEPFARLIDRAQLIGGARQIDEQTYQVRVELRGDRVATTLVDIANQNPQRSPIKPDALAQALAEWKNRSFSVTGSSLSFERAQSLPPGAISPVWRSVTKEAQEQAKAAARDDAVNRVLDEVGPVRVGEKTAGDIIQDADSVRMTLSDWLRKRPVNNLVFGDDLRVSYTLSASGDELFDQFVAAARQAKIPLGLDAAGYEAARAEFRRRVTPTTGSSGKDKPMWMKQPGDAAPATIPQQPPDWVFQQIDATGEAKFRESTLQTQQEAVDRATDSIRAKLLALPLTKTETVRDAAKHDPLVRDAVKRAIAQARLYGVSYPADGGVSVKMVLDPREFWQALTAP